MAVALGSVHGLIWLLALVQTFAGLLVLASPELEQKLESVCDKKLQGKDSQVVAFGSVDEVKQLIKYYKSHTEICSTQYKDAMLSLDSILSKEVLDDVCTLRVYKKLRKFHEMFIHYFVPELNEFEIKQKRRMMKGNKVRALRPIPEAFRRFFIVFAKQINALCRMAIPDQIKRLSKDLNLDHELDTIDEFRQKAKASIRKVMFSDTLTRKRRHNLNLDELQLFDHANSRLYVNVRPDHPLWLMKDICAKRLRPIYNEVFTGIIKLNGLGYRDRTISGELLGDALKKEPSITRWYQIIQICELIKDIEVVDRHDAATGLIKEEAITTSDDDDDDDLTLHSIDEDGQTHEGKQPTRAVKVTSLEVIHAKVSFGNELRLAQDELSTAQEVRNFDRYIKISVLERTNYFMLIRYDTKLFFGILFGTTAARAGDFTTGVMKWLGKHGLLTKRTGIEAVVFTLMLIGIIAAAHG